MAGAVRNEHSVWSTGDIAVVDWGVRDKGCARVLHLVQKLLVAGVAKVTPKRHATPLTYEILLEATA